MRNYINIRYIVFIVFLAFSVVVSAQDDLRKDVTVVKPYQPTINDASKISNMPVFDDTSKVTPRFNYSITPNKLTPVFQPRPVKAASLATEPLSQLYNSYIKVGLGFPLSPLAEVSINNLRSRQTSYGIYLKHYSSNGSVKLKNNQKSDTKFADNEVDVYGKQINKEYVVSGGLGYLGNKANYYGYNTDNFPTLTDTIDIQSFNMGRANIKVESTNMDSSTLYYNAGAAYYHLGDKFTNSENNLNISGKGSQYYMDYYVGADVNFDYYGIKLSDSSTYNTIISVSPWLTKSSADWKFLVGITTTYDFNDVQNKAHFYPRANLQFNVVPKVLIAFIGLDGYLKPNTMLGIATENIYAMPGSRVQSANCKINVNGGIKGEISSDLDFNLKADYSVIDKEHFYINDTIDPLANKFIVLYDNIEQMHIGLQTGFKASEKLHFYSQLDWYKYNLTHQNEAWHKPTLEWTLTTRYNIRNKILASVDLYAVGKRYALNPVTRKAMELNPFADVNLKLEYRYSKVMSVFMQVRNLTASKYSVWNQYPAYRFQIMAGLTYML